MMKMIFGLPDGDSGHGKLGDNMLWHDVLDDI